MLVNVPAGAVLTPFITTADLIVAEDVVPLGLSVERNNQIGLYLAAHFYVVSSEYGGFTEQIVNDSEERYQVLSSDTYGLATTRFGRQVLALDTTGKLSKMATSPQKARFSVI